MTESKNLMEQILLRAIQASLGDNTERWNTMLNTLMSQINKNPELYIRLSDILDSLIEKGYIIVDDKVERTTWDGDVFAANDNARKIVASITAVSEEGNAFLAQDL